MKTKNHTLLSIATALTGLTTFAVSEPEEASPKLETPAPEVSITISEPGFEASGNWKNAKTGASVGGLFINENLTNYLKAGLIDKPTDSRSIIAYNNGPDQDVYQVLEATIAANTTYQLSIIAIDTTFSNPFPGGELRLGYVSASPTANDDFDWNLLKPTKVDNPLPFNDHENDPGNTTDGITTWTTTFTTGATPIGIGQKLRIEILGGGKAQAVFDNVKLDARAATPTEIVAATKLVKIPEKQPVVVMFGDSTTDGGMALAVQKELNKLISSEKLCPNMINAGKGGDYAVAALKRLEKDVLKHKPDIVTISFGLNDTGLRKPDEYKDSLKRMIRTFEDAGIQILLLTSTPFNNQKHGWAKKFEELGGLDEYMDKEYCDRMRSLADKNDILLCDLHAIFKNEFKKDADMVNKLISGDGVHLTAEGYQLIAKHVAPNIIKRLSKE